MHNKKKLIIVTAGVILSLGIVGFYSIKPDKEKSLELQEKRSMIAMYLEDESGEYKLSSSKEFPKEGYVLNLEKSTCTNGGVLSQDSETKLISLRTSNSTKCDLYFERSYDIYRYFIIKSEFRNYNKLHRWKYR